MPAVKSKHQKRIGCDATDFRSTILDSPVKPGVVLPKCEKPEFNLRSARSLRVSNPVCRDHQASREPSPASEACMNVHISYRVHRTPDVEKEINHLIEKLRKRLQVFRPELVHLKGNIEQNSPREGIIVSFNLRLPSGQMAVQE